MRVLGAVVQALVLPMLNTRHHDPFRSGIAGQFIGDHHARCLAMLLEQLAQQALRRFGIATTLDQNVEYGPVLIDGAPEPMLPAGDLDHDLASRAGESHPRALPEPYVTWSRASASYLLVLFRCPLPKPDMSLSVSSGFPVSYLTPSRTVPVDVLVAPGTDDQSFATA